MLLHVHDDDDGCSGGGCYFLILVPHNLEKGKLFPFLQYSGILISQTLDFFFMLDLYFNTFNSVPLTQTESYFPLLS